MSVSLWRLVFLVVEVRNDVGIAMETEKKPCAGEGRGVECCLYYVCECI